MILGWGLNKMKGIDKIIHNLFSTRWNGNLRKAPIEAMRLQLRKNLQNQIDGYWTGHTAYQIMVDGGFLIDAKRIPIKSTGMSEGKKLTALGQSFMNSMNLT